MSEEQQQNEITEWFKVMLADLLSVDEAEVKPEALVRDDLGADSLDITELVMQIEDKYNVEIPDDEDLDRLKTVQQWFEFAEGHKK